MGQAQFQIVSQCLPIANCSLVSLCLYSEWADRTLSGVPIVTGKVIAIGKTNIPANAIGCASPVIVTSGPQCGNVYKTSPAPNRTIPACVYTVNVDLDSQFQINPQTNLPWVLTEDDICAIDSSNCTTQALITAIQTSFGVQVDATLKRDGGIIGINDAALPDDGVVSYVGIDAAGNAVRIPDVIAFGYMSGESESLDLMADSILTLVDYDLIEYDPLGMITTGPAWNVTVPYKGVYRLNASVRFSNTTWGHHGLSDLAALNLWSKKNGGTEEIIDLQYASDFDMLHTQAPMVSGTRDFVLNKDDVLQIFASHTDTESDVIHSLVAGAESRFSIQLVAFVQE